jgi:nucleotide-binding universal stress UspA family protein
MCPVDFTESSIATLDDAASLARKLDAQLIIVHVDEPSPVSGAASSSCSSHEDDRRSLLERAAPTEYGISIEHHVVQGIPGDEIPRFARLHDVDLVVMGRHNAKERLHARYNGVCDLTSRMCRCPVMTVTHTAEHPPWMRVDGDGWSPV